MNCSLCKNRSENYVSIPCLHPTCSKCKNGICLICSDKITNTFDRSGTSANFADCTNTINRYFELQKNIIELIPQFEKYIQSSDEYSEDKYLNRIVRKKKKYLTLFQMWLNQPDFNGNINMMFLRTLRRRCSDIKCVLDSTITT